MKKLKWITCLSDEAELGEIIEVVRVIFRFLGSLGPNELISDTDEVKDVSASWTEFERKKSGLGIDKFNLAKIFDDSVVGGLKSFFLLTWFWFPDIAVSNFGFFTIGWVWLTPLMMVFECVKFQD